MKSLLVLLLLLVPSYVIGAPKLSSGVAFDGVIAYQDDQDPTQFHYVPARVDLSLGTTPADFSVKYWGIGNPFYVKNSRTGEIRSITGAIMSGRATIDISTAQRDGIIAEIKKAYKIDNPKLLPVQLKNTQKRVTPVFARNTLEFGENPDIVFPENVALSSTFNYTIGTGNALFAAAAASSSAQSGVIADPTFGINVIGDVEFVGDPWKCHVRADLKQVWKQVRQRYGASVRLGFFKIGGADYQSIIQDLQRSGAITLTTTEGSLDNEKFGRQIFEAAKTIFEQLNQKAASGDGFFKFEPNPEAPATSGGSSGLSRLWGWGISINGSYSSSSFTQNFVYETDLTYTGRVIVQTPVSMTLAVFCTPATRDMFVDLRDGSSCITKDKMDIYSDRMQKERVAKQGKLKILDDRLIAGTITSDEYYKVKKVILENSIDDIAFSSSTVVKSTFGTTATLAIKNKPTLVQNSLTQKFAVEKGTPSGVRLVELSTAIR